MSVSFAINDFEVRSQLLKQIYTLRQHPHVVVSGTYRDLPTRELLHLSEDLTAALKLFENTKKRVIHNQVKVDRFMNTKYRHRKSEATTSSKEKVLRTHTRSFLGQEVRTVDLVPTNNRQDHVRSLRAQTRACSFENAAPYASLEHLFQEGEELATIESTVKTKSLPDVLFLQRRKVATSPETVNTSQETTRETSSAQLPASGTTLSSPDDLANEEETDEVSHRYFTQFDEFADQPPPEAAASHDQVMLGPRVSIFNNLPVEQLSGTLHPDNSRFSTPFLDLSSFLTDEDFNPMTREDGNISKVNLDQIGPYLNPHTETRPGLLDIVISDLSGHIIVENAQNADFDHEVSEYYSEATSRLGDEHLFHSDEE